MMTKSPDNDKFAAGEEISIEQKHSSGHILEASATNRAGWPETMAPEWLRVSETPWLSLQFGDARGYAHLNWIHLQWDQKTISHKNLAGALKAAGARGMLRNAFLSPFRAVLLKLAPAPGSLVLSINEKNEVVRKTTDGTWSQVDALYCDPADPHRMLMVFSNDSSVKLFQFVEQGRPILRFVQQEHQPYISHVEVRDLNGDGKREWLLEVVGFDGKGSYSMLWRVDTNKTVLERTPMSRTSGENASLEVAASWWVSPGRDIWIGRSNGASNTFQKLRYDMGKRKFLSHSPREGVWLAVLAESKDYRRAQGVAVESEKAGSAVGVFPYGRGGALTWITGIPFESESAAQQWVGQHSGSQIFNVACACCTNPKTSGPAKDERLEALCRVGVKL
ncbi:MAG: hypothetical protein U1F42_05060 [Candidatus Competibacteraceae bacterium]